MKEELKEELKEVYFGFYDELLEPYCSEAKKAWSYKISFGTLPTSLRVALSFGFVFSKNPSVDWIEVHGSITEGETTYLKKPDTTPLSLGATEEQIHSYLVYLVVESMGKEKLSKKNILKKAKILYSLL
jgi:hypothetical protein